MGLGQNPFGFQQCNKSYFKKIISSYEKISCIKNFKHSPAPVLPVHCQQQPEVGDSLPSGLPESVQGLPRL